MRITSIVFDLDDTLYLEQDYVRSGIRAVGEWFAKRTGITEFAETAERLWGAGRRQMLFDATLQDMGIANSQAMIHELVETYRNHPPVIALANDALDLLASGSEYRFALITDGIASTQRQKIEALGLSRFGFDPIIATGDLGIGFHKPHRRAFEAVMESHRIESSAIVYVADNPAKDFLAPKALGWRTIQIDRPAAVHPRTPPDPDHAAEAHITTLADLHATLQYLLDVRR
ncbi:MULTISPECIES: HAD family hydrolase [unclassified Sphingomonas]|uniref:HAD family hydrolase n=1 Tax=unclassified Sphingomonas TaxID=196159 RepID=UPI001D12E032|nr:MULTISPECIES: HAD family hydrolase [unclassified Sphingomonas]MCC2981312.1 HAD family hydrolase [Sphingomonas sp. IC4-52]MCD2317024.1 HAD family hydrolase [Sphingomonas sp. IC-11]